MHRFAAVLLCTVCVFAVAARGQNAKIEAVQAPLGTVLTFHLQTRMNPADPNEMDVLPRQDAERSGFERGSGWKRISWRSDGAGVRQRQSDRAS